jgi:hypothetical protein
LSGTPKEACLVEDNIANSNHIKKLMFNPDRVLGIDRGTSSRARWPT